MKKETFQILVDNHVSIVCLLEEKERLKSLVMFRDELNEKSPDDALLSEVDNDIRCLQEKVHKSEAHIESLKPDVDVSITAIDDAISRVAASLHYRKGLSWDEVSHVMGYKTYSPEAIRSRVYRYMRKTNI